MTSTLHGFGLGLRPQHYRELLAADSACVDWLEIVSENYMIDGGRPLAMLDRIAERWPLAMHGVSLDIGGSAPLDRHYLRDLAKLARRARPAIVSDHLCWTRAAGTQLHDLLPLPRTGNRSPSRSYSGLLQCAGERLDDAVYIMIQPDAAETFPALMRIIGRPELIEDERFATPEARFQHYDELTEVIEAWTGSRDKREVHRAFASAGIPCGAVLDTAELIADPDLRERGVFVTVDHPERGEIDLVGMPIRLSESTVTYASPPLLGADTDDVLTTIVGLSPEAITALKNEGIV